MVNNDNYLLAIVVDLVLDDGLESVLDFLRRLGQRGVAVIFNLVSPAGLYFRLRDWHRSCNENMIT